MRKAEEILTESAAGYQELGGYRFIAVKAIEQAQRELVKECIRKVELWVPPPSPGRGSGPATANEACHAIAENLRALLPHREGQ